MKFIIGRKNCHYNRDWYVKFNLISGQEADIAEQLRGEEAKIIYNEVKNKLQDKSDFIEIKTEQDVDTDNFEFFLKKNILSVEMKRK